MDIAIYILAGIGGATIIVLLVSLFNNMFRNTPEPYVPMIDADHTRPYTVEGLPPRVELRTNQGSTGVYLEKAREYFFNQGERDGY